MAQIQNFGFEPLLQKHQAGRTTSAHERPLRQLGATGYVTGVEEYI